MFQIERRSYARNSPLVKLQQEEKRKTGVLFR
jgi:hypothetical protein